jgi:hypothetical protein
MTSIRLVLVTELISVLIGVFLLHILRNTRGTVNQGATLFINLVGISENTQFFLPQLKAQQVCFLF